MDRWCNKLLNTAQNFNMIDTKYLSKEDHCQIVPPVSQQLSSIIYAKLLEIVLVHSVCFSMTRPALCLGQLKHCELCGLPKVGNRIPSPKWLNSVDSELSLTE